MSLFLGKIHYWLFNKILWFEGLEEEVINLAKEEGLDTSKLSKDISLKYGEKSTNKKLEEIIDTNNIHGWLQSKIHSSEGRMAAWTSIILDNNFNSISKLQDIYSSQGIKAAREIKFDKSIETAKDVYQSMNDYILDGMPCDRINQISILEDNLVSWSRKACVHKEIWDNENIDVNIFYNLRSFWIKSFVNELNNKYIYIENSEVYTIKESIMINKDHTIGEILEMNHNSADVLMEFGMGCLGCPSASTETLEQACFIHGISLDDVLSKLNNM